LGTAFMMLLAMPLWMSQEEGSARGPSTFR